MKGFKQCDKGHFYNDTLEECNYCPKKTTVDQNENQPHTEALSGDSSEKTQVFSGSTNLSSEENKSANTFDPNKTTIGGRVASEGQDNQSIQRRRLRGWLVSFDIEPFGVDFKVNEGRNSIGSKASNDITIQDHQVSSLHGLILYKKNKFILTDELSTNGTLLNGEELVPRDTYELNDGDEIKIGDTSLLFKTAFKN